MSMRYTGKNWQTMRKVGRNDQTLLEQIRKAKEVVNKKANRDSGQVRQEVTYNTGTRFF